ncbi:hypothetical protein ACIQTZ_22970 [Paenarthrobacter sp. NPDC090520]|uniref:hypothetical protein n=1 Tax=Paenarthrobacter sp. NPDC090520 TaxID=3364382 RepID=UPI00382DDBDB
MFLKLFKSNSNTRVMQVVNLHEVRAFEFDDDAPRNPENPGSVTFYWRAGENTTYKLGVYDEAGRLLKKITPAQFETAFSDALRAHGIYTLDHV